MVQDPRSARPGRGGWRAARLTWTAPAGRTRAAGGRRRVPECGALSKKREPEVGLDRLNPEMRAFAGESMPWQVRRRRPAARRSGSTEAAPSPALAAERDGAEGGSGADGGSGREPSLGPHVLIVGGGAVGGALAHDLSLRGVRVTVVEKGELASGSTGRGQGLLHSGARYATTDRALAVDCAAENKLLRRLAPGSFEENDGLFVALTDDDAEFGTRFLEACWQAAVPARRLTRDEALRAEPGLNPDLRFAVRVPDATMDTMRLPLRFFATARSNGADVRPFTEVVGVRVVDGAVTGVRVRDRAADREYEIGADVVVNAAGSWAGRVAALAGVSLPVTFSWGAMASIRGRPANMIVSRLRPSGDAGVVVPERRSTVIGPLLSPTDQPDPTSVDGEAIDSIRREAALLVPALADGPIRARWTASSARDAAVGRAGPTDRFVLVDHGTGPKPLVGFLTLSGGPATTMRATAQAGADLVCARLGVDRPCGTMDAPLLPHTAWYAR